MCEPRSTWEVMKDATVHSLDVAAEVSWTLSCECCGEEYTGEGSYDYETRRPLEPCDFCERYHCESCGEWEETGEHICRECETEIQADQARWEAEQRQARSVTP